MTQNQSNFFLFPGKGASSVFERIQRNDRTDSKQKTIADYPELLLAGGFNSVSSGHSYMLSAALKLNGDLAMFDDSQLKYFAEAELRRTKQSVFKSYTIDPDNHVCVLSNNADQLDRFLDIYGGILQVEPLLLKTCTSHYDTVTDYSITDNNNAYRIDYSVRSPVDLSKCNYCGDCGLTCPEDCISETLFFDYNACTFCKECEKICTQSAIDIYAVEKRELNIPAIIVLEDTHVNLPAQRRNIFSDNEITKYLSTLFPYQVEEVLVCNPDICQNSKRAKGGCSKCIDICPAGAITVEDAVKIDVLSCTECGKCAGICPTGAIQYQRFPDAFFMEFFRDFPMRENSTVIIGTEKSLHRFWWKQHDKSFIDHLFFDYPNINALSLFHLLFLLAHGANRVVILEDNSENSLISKTVNNANLLINRFFDKPSRINLYNIDEYSAVTLQEHMPTLADITYNDLNYINRRQKLSSILHFLSNQCKNDLELKRNEFPDFAGIDCDEDKCTQCLACLNECKIEALAADPTALKLSWNGSFCIGCGACIAICPEEALSFSDTVRIDQNYFSPATLAQAEPMQCKECGITFGTKKSFDHVMQILSAKDMHDDGFFEYCDECRVRKLLESE